MDMKIRTKSGEVIDLVEARKQIEKRIIPGKLCPELVILDALESVIKVPYRTPMVSAGDGASASGYNTAIRAIRATAGVIEEAVK